MEAIVIYPVSAIIPTYKRETALVKTLGSLVVQSALPAEIIIIDAGDYKTTEALLPAFPPAVKVIVLPAEKKGAAAQRETGLLQAACPYILFMDDDIEFYPHCFRNLWAQLQAKKAGGVNALVINQQFAEPGKITRMVYKLLGGGKLSSFAGKCFGPAINLLTNKDSGSEDAIPVDWLNTTCTLYPRNVLPCPLFPAIFDGYSFMEDVAMSMEIGKAHSLYTIKSAVIFHDSQPGNDKSNLARMSEMELVNRHYIMRKVMGKKGITPLLQLAGFQLFGALAGKQLFKSAFWKGKWR
ncbi:MAG: glycosyltransferase family 2 protein, partial [Bacteroidetes bacterium]|nr:glycosyltransferase family 2 protein [Bacteroidota bacterium]